MDVNNANDVIFRDLPPSPFIQGDMEIVTIGSDPEFGIIDAKTKRQIRADSVLEPSYRTLVGVDGHSHLGEMRPIHGNDPFIHLGTIKRLMYALKGMVKTMEAAEGRSVEVIAGSMVADDFMGGHIHIGRKKSHKFINVLDYYLMPIMACIEPKKPFLRRVTGRCSYGAEYGRLFDVRRKTYGVEYRTPQSWLYSESIARGILVTAWTLASYVRLLKRTPKKSTDIEIAEAYYKHDYPFLRRVALTALDKILFLTSRHGRDAFLSVCTLKGLIKERKTRHEGDILRRWNFRDQQIAPPVVSMDVGKWGEMNPVRGFLRSSTCREMLPFPLAISIEESYENTIHLYIDPSIASLMGNIREMLARFENSYNFRCADTRITHEVCPAAGGMRAIYPSSLMHYGSGIFTDLCVCIKGIWEFPNADTLSEDLDD